MRVLFASLTVLLPMLIGCQTVSEHRDQIRPDESEKVTVGTVQKEIRVGMAASDVAGALGSPNIVTTDEERREVWLYDKISSETAYSTSSGGVSALILGYGGGVAGGLGTGYGSSTGATKRSQRTLTVIIKFDNQNRVRDFAYHTSRF